MAGLGLMVSSGAAHAQAARHEMPAIILGNPAEWFGPDQYPLDALRSLRQGRVVAAISVDLTGQATGCTIDVSSGTTSLDKATCDIALAHAAFNPATDRRGKPVTSIYKLPVKWILPDDIPPLDAKTAPLQSTVEVQIVADEEGMGVSCRTIAKTGVAPDPCLTFKPGVRVGRGYVRDGRKVGSTAVYKQSSTITIDP
ncbi:TonB protein C-terminal [Sphingomonas sp. NFR15]|nr:TonB protein C-terminal [Sphingomonas sp. NFR15]